MKSYMFATYVSKSYLPFLQACLRGCQLFLDELPLIFALDTSVVEYAKEHALPYEYLKFDHIAPHTLSLQILRTCEYEHLFLIDADCLPLNKISLLQISKFFSSLECVGLGDIGHIDLPYLFYGLRHDQVFLRIHETFGKYPQFAKKWINSAFIPSYEFSTGAVVDIPLLYGGFAAYKTEYFRGIDYPAWIHSADIWLSIYCFENNLSFYKFASYQFNTKISNNYPFLHFAGVKDWQLIETRLKKYNTFLESKS